MIKCAGILICVCFIIQCKLKPNVAGQATYEKLKGRWSLVEYTYKEISIVDKLSALYPTKDPINKSLLVIGYSDDYARWEMDLKAINFWVLHAGNPLTANNDLALSDDRSNVQKWFICPFRTDKQSAQWHIEELTSSSLSLVLLTDSGEFKTT